MPRPALGDKPMTAVERSARRRARQGHIFVALALAETRIGDVLRLLEQAAAPENATFARHLTADALSLLQDTKIQANKALTGGDF